MLRLLQTWRRTRAKARSTSKRTSDKARMSPKQSRRVSGGLSQHRFQLRLGEFLRLRRYPLMRRHNLIDRAGSRLPTTPASKLMRESRNEWLWNGRLWLQNGRSHGVRLMLAFGLKISSKGNDDLTELAAVLQIAVHFHHIVELEYTVDDRLESATRKALGDVLHRDLPTGLVSRHQPDAVPLDRWHLADHFQHGDRGVILAQCAVDVGDALIGQRGDQLGKVRATDGIEGNARAGA